MLGSAKLTFFIKLEKQTSKKRRILASCILLIAFSIFDSCVMVLAENHCSIEDISSIGEIIAILRALNIIVVNVFPNTSDGIYVVFTWAIRIANGLASAPIADLPDTFASNITVPVPQKGSRTTPSLGQKYSVCKKKYGMLQSNFAG